MGIRFIDLNELIDKGQSILKYSPYLTSLQKQYHQSINASNTSNNSKIVDKYRQFLKYIQYGMFALLVIGYFIGGRLFLFINIVILLFAYAIYV